MVSHKQDKSLFRSPEATLHDGYMLQHVKPQEFKGDIVVRVNIAIDLNLFLFLLSSPSLSLFKLLELAGYFTQNQIWQVLRVSFWHKEVQKTKKYK